MKRTKYSGRCKPAERRTRAVVDAGGSVGGTIRKHETLAKQTRLGRLAGKTVADRDDEEGEWEGGHLVVQLAPGEPCTRQFSVPSHTPSSMGWATAGRELGPFWANVNLWRERGCEFAFDTGILYVVRVDEAV